MAFLDSFIQTIKAPFQPRTFEYTAPPSPELPVVKTFKANVSAYNPDPLQTDETPEIGAWGENLVDLTRKGINVVASDDYPQGTKIRILGTVYEVHDRISKDLSQKGKLDIFMLDRNEAINFGRKKNTPVEVLGETTAKPPLTSQQAIQQGLASPVGYTGGFKPTPPLTSPIAPLTLKEATETIPWQKPSPGATLGVMVEPPSAQPPIGVLGQPEQAVGGFLQRFIAKAVPKEAIIQPGGVMEAAQKASQEIRAKIGQPIVGAITEFVRKAERMVPSMIRAYPFTAPIYEKVLKPIIEEPILKGEAEYHPKVGEFIGTVAGFAKIAGLVGQYMVGSKFLAPFVRAYPKLSRIAQFAITGEAMDLLKTDISTSVAERQKALWQNLPINLLGGVFFEQPWKYSIPSLLVGTFADAKLKGLDSNQSLTQAVLNTSMMSLFKFSGYPTDPAATLKQNALRNLELGPKPTEGEIKTAYRKLAEQNHPDKGGDPVRFAQVTNAYKFLTNPKGIIQEIKDAYFFLKTPSGRQYLSDVLREIPIGLGIREIKGVPEKPIVPSVSKELQPLAQEARIPESVKLKQTYLTKLNEERGIKVSEQNKDLLGKYTFTIHKWGYPVAKVEGKNVYLHDLVLGTENIKGKGVVIDHINRNPLDNRIENLRITTQKLNQYNRDILARNTSGITGVNLNKEINKWIARITVDGKNVHLGSFLTLDEAVKARKIAETQYIEPLIKEAQAVKGVKEVKPEVKPPIPKVTEKIPPEVLAEVKAIQNEYTTDLSDAILRNGGIKVTPDIKEEILTNVPIHLQRTKGLAIDDMIQVLQNQGYNFSDTDDLLAELSKLKGRRIELARVTRIERRLEEVGKITPVPAPPAITETEAEKMVRDIIKINEIKPTLRTKQIIARVTGIKPPEEMVTRTEMQLLKGKLRAEAKGARGAIIQYKKEQRILESISNEITRELNKPKGLQRSTISFIKQLGEFKQTAINEIKTELSIEKSISQMNLEELNDFVGKFKERLRFKFERGYRPSVETIEKLNIESKQSPKPELTGDFYQTNREIKSKPPKRRFVIIGKKIGRGIEKTLTPISTRLENIDPTLKAAMRKFEWEQTTATYKDNLAIKPYLNKTKTGIFKKMSKEDSYDLDLALKNGDADKINEINKKYKVESEYENVRKTLDDIYKRANEVGYDIGYQKDYWPRAIKDPEGFLEYFGKQEYWSILDEAIKRKEMDLGRYLTIDEKATLVNTMIRGYRGGQITLSKIGAMKERVIDLVTPELNQFYYDSPTALISYIHEANNAIAARRFFGKGNKDEGFNNIDDSIGAYVTDLLGKGKITPSQEMELRNILNARFNPKGMHGLVGLYKNLAYIDVMGSVYNAITQFGDIAWAVYRGGWIRAGKAFGRAVVGKAKITKEDMGIERIAQEFSDGNKVAKTVDTVFKLTGLDKIDRLGKESLVNAAVSKYQKLAQNPTPEFLKKMNDIFGPETEQVLTDLKSGQITENVKYLAFNELLDFQPIALSEMSEEYLRGGNGRIFYMLKSYTLKMFDVFRREAFREIAKGNWFKGIKNLLYLISLVVLLNGVADEAKDLLLGRKTKLSDRTVDQLAMLVGFSRYTVGRISEVGLGRVAMEQIFPTTQFIDNASKDLMALYKDFDKSADINELRTVKDIPLVGKLYYWWFGKGVETKEKYETPEEISSFGASTSPTKKSLFGAPTLPAKKSLFGL